MDYNKTDPEFVERVTHFISEEVKKEPGQELDDSTRYLAVLAALAGCQAGTDYGDRSERGSNGSAAGLSSSGMHAGMGRMCRQRVCHSVCQAVFWRHRQ